MGNKRKKYYILTAVFTVVFFLCMAFILIRFTELARDYVPRSLSYRKESIELEEQMYGPEHLFYSLYFQDNYEEEFDSCWDFADAYLAYRMGRIAENKAPYAEKIQTYLESAPGGMREKEAQNYLKELLEDNQKAAE